MQSFIITLLICSVTMSLLALFYMAITPLLAKRYSATYRYYTWLVIVTGLTIPFRPHFDNAIVKVDMPSNTVVPNIQVGNGTPVTPHFNNILTSAFPTISLWQIAAVVWLVGVIVFLAYHAVKHYRFLKLVARWSKNITDEQTLALIQELKSQMGINKKIGLQICDSIGSPMMIGFTHPRILLPKSDFANNELCFILKHEFVHYKRKDLWYKCLVLIATAIHWFNPIVYLMAKAIDIQCELSCDEKVVRGTSADIRLYYSETIIGVVRHQSKLKTALSTNFYGGKKGMKKRIFSIMDMSKKKKGVAVLCAALLLTLGTGFAFATSASASSATIQSVQQAKANGNTTTTDITSSRVIRNGKVYYIFCDGADESNKPTVSSDGNTATFVLVRKDSYTSISDFNSLEKLVDEVTEQCDDMLKKGLITQDEARLLVEVATKIQSGNDSEFIDYSKETSHIGEYAAWW